MTIASEILTITDFTDDNSNVSNAVTEATSFCAMHDVTADEIIKTVAIWLLERQRDEHRGEIQDSILDVHKIIRDLKGEDVDTATIIISEYKSPNELGLDPFTW